ncbi:hypothetical protein JCM16303_006592 [Sporobolomyces ruberrimus]
MPAIGTIVYDGVKPLIRVFITTALGFLLIKRNIVPRDGINVFSHLIVNVTLPSLLFSKIVPSFTSDNIGALGPIFLVGITYQFLAAALGLIVRSFTPTPRRYRYGLVAAYTFSNWGDLPIGVISSIMTSSPFNKGTDEALGIAYVAIFILINYISQFPLQGLRLVALDYTRGVSAEDERRSEDGEFGTFRKYLNRLLRGMPMAHEIAEARRVHYDEDEKTSSAHAGDHEDGTTCPTSSEASTARGHDNDITSVHPGESPTPPISNKKGFNTPVSPPATARTLSTRRQIWNGIKSCIKHTLVPPTISLVCSIIIGVIPVLRNLFVAADPANSRFSPEAPDGQPPLSTIYDAAAFIGAASVPLGLIVLGASIATIELPRPITRLPLASMCAMAIVKLAVLPVFGFFFVQALVRAQVVDSGNKVLIFVLTSLSCVPTSTIQVVWSRLLAPPGVENNSTLLGAYLLVQYFVWAISSVLITAFTLNTLF